MDKILEIQQLSKAYRSVKAVKNLTLQINEGQAYGLLGPNGSGKTTTLSILSGILHQDSGSFRWFDEKPSAKQRKKIGSLIENPHFYPYLSLEKNLKIICEIKAITYKDIDRTLDETGLLNRKHSKFKTLSLGMKQRLGIAATLLGDPSILVMDEPTNGLDPEGIVEVRNTIIGQVERGKTLILASHILSEVEKICSHVAILKQGELLAAGAVKELLAEEEIVELSSTNNEILFDQLIKSEITKDVHKENGFIVASLASDKRIEDINSFAFEQKIVLTHLLSRKKSLEAQFLELVKE